MQTISLANRKGGVGKTTIAANLAAELARMGHVVLAIDLDPQADLTKLLLGDHAGPTVFGALAGAHGIAEACFQVGDGLYLVPGDCRLAEHNFRGKENALADCLADPALAAVDFVVVDHPPAISGASLAGLVASDWVLVPTDAEAFGVANLSRLLEDIEAVRESMNPGLGVMGVVVNKLDMRRGLTAVVLRELRAVHGDMVLRATISNDTALPMSARLGLTVRGLWWRSRTVPQVRALAEEILERMSGDGD